jgi:hypothetical protein
MRTLGHDAEYLPTGSPEIAAVGACDDQKTVEGLIDLANPSYWAKCHHSVCIAL